MARSPSLGHGRRGPLAGCRARRRRAKPPRRRRRAENALVAQAREALKRAETAPLPDAAAAAFADAAGWKPLPAPELKPEEIEAIRLLEQAVAAQPGEREPHELLARALEPYALRQHERAVAARGKKIAAPGAARPGRRHQPRAGGPRLPRRRRSRPAAPPTSSIP